MFVTHNREKLINAIIYFVKNTKRCHKLKLFKLLSFLDFEHYRQSGRSVTGLRYDAWPMGPVPSDLDREIAHPGNDLSAAVAIFKTPARERRERTIDDYFEEESSPGLMEFLQSHADRAQGPGPSRERFEFKPKKRFDPQFFTKREMRIMEVIAEIFGDAKGNDMTEVSHLKDQPWNKVFGDGKGNGQPIPFELALSSAPILKDMPTIDAEERGYRDEALKEVRRYTES